VVDLEVEVHLQLLEAMVDLVEEPQDLLVLEEQEHLDKVIMAV
jgi:hypothetical protein